MTVTDAETSVIDSQPKRGRGRPITNKTKLGRLLNDRGTRLYLLCGATNISPRVMTEYMQGRRIIHEDHAVAICEYFKVNPADIHEDWLTSNLTQVTGASVAKPDAEVAASRERVFGGDEPWIPIVAPKYM